MVASGLSISPSPRSTLPPSSLNQYLVSPSGPFTTCWMRAVIEPAADFTASLCERAPLTSLAHSSDRNFTATAASLFRGRPGQYSGATPPQLTAGQSAPRRPFALFAAVVPCPRRRDEHLRVGDVADVVEEPDPAALLRHDYRVDRGVLRQEEHILVDPQDVGQVGVDDAAVSHHQHVAPGMPGQHPFDGRDHPFAELGGGLPARGHADHGLELPE